MAEGMISARLTPVLSFLAKLAHPDKPRLLRALGATVRDQSRRRILDQDTSFPHKSRLFQDWGGGTKTLFKKGHLARSIVYALAGENVVRVGSPLPYAARQQYGGTGKPGSKHSTVFWILPEYEPSPHGESGTVDGAMGVRRSKDGRLVRHHYFGESVSKDGKVTARKHGWRIKRYPNGIPMGLLVATGKNNDPGNGAVPVLLSINVRPRPFIQDPSKNPRDSRQILDDLEDWTAKELARMTRANGGPIRA